MENLYNDEADVLARSAQALESNEQFKAATQRFGELTQAGTGMIGQGQVAFANAGRGLADSGAQVYGRMLPRLEGVQGTAAMNASVAEDAAAGLSGVDINLV